MSINISYDAGDQTFECPSSVIFSPRVLMSHSLTVRSMLHDATVSVPVNRSNVRVFSDLVALVSVVRSCWAFDWCYNSREAAFMLLCFQSVRATRPSDHFISCHSWVFVNILCCSRCSSTRDCLSLCGNKILLPSNFE